MWAEGGQGSETVRQSGDALDDDSADENKWDSGRIINKSGRLHHCALSVISLPRPDRSSPSPSAVWLHYVTAPSSLQRQEHTWRSPRPVANRRSRSDGITHTHKHTSKPEHGVTFPNKSADQCSLCLCDRYLWICNTSQPYLKPEIPFHFLTALSLFLSLCVCVSPHMSLPT